MNIGSNLKTLRRRKNLSQEEIASSLGLTRSTYSGYENGIAQPNLDNLISISEFHQINIDDLIKKDYASFTEIDWKNFEKSHTKDIKGHNLRVLTAVVNQENEELIEMIPVKASAGYVEGYADPDYIKVLPTFTLPFLSKDRKYRSFPIKGDSMPPVVEGSYVVGEFVQNWLSIRNGTPCIVITKEDGIVFKVLYNKLETDQSFLLCSTNTFYQPYLVHVNEILEIWKFVNYISPELPDIQLDNDGVSKSIMDLQREVNDLKNILVKKSG